MGEKISKMATAILGALPKGALFVGIRGYRAKPIRKWAARVASEDRKGAVLENLIARGPASPGLSDRAREEFGAFRALLKGTETDAELAALVEAGVEATGEVQDLVMTLHVRYDRLRARDASVLRVILADLDASAAIGTGNVARTAEVLGLPTRLVEKALRGVDKEPLSEANVLTAAEDIRQEKEGERDRSASVDAREANYSDLLGLDGQPIQGLRVHTPDGEVRISGLVARRTVVKTSNVPPIPVRYRDEVSRAAAVLRDLLPSSLWREYRLVEGNFDSLTTDGVTVEDRHFGDALSR